MELQFGIRQGYHGWIELEMRQLKLNGNDEREEQKLRWYAIGGLQVC
jgi:hypothetical protein